MKIINNNNKENNKKKFNLQAVKVSLIQFSVTCVENINEWKKQHITKFCIWNQQLSITLMHMNQVIWKKVNKL